jgi:hypothetical protein
MLILDYLLIRNVLTTIIVSSAQHNKNLIKKTAVTHACEIPPYRPDQAPSDFHMFGAQKDAIRRTKFETDDDVIRA